MRQWLALLAALAVLILICVLPIAAVVWQASGAGWAAWSILLDDEVQQAVWNTLRFSFVALLLATLLGVLHALASQRSVLWRAAAFLPFVISPVTVAFGLLLLYPAWTASLALLLSTYALLAYPFVAKSLAAGLDSLPPSVLSAARTLGANPWHTFWRVTLPMLRPALRRGMAFAAATALGEFAVTLFLSRPEWTTLTTLIYQRLSHPGERSLNEALVLACVLMAFAMLAFLIIEWPAGESQRVTSKPGATLPARGLRHA
jgi:thiamine transport system permease protein